MASSCSLLHSQFASFSKIDLNGKQFVAKSRTTLLNWFTASTNGLNSFKVIGRSLSVIPCTSVFIGIIPALHCVPKVRFLVSPVGVLWYVHFHSFSDFVCFVNFLGFVLYGVSCFCISCFVGVFLRSSMFWFYQYQWVAVSLRGSYRLKVVRYTQH